MSEETPKLLSINYSNAVLERIKKAKSTMILPKEFIKNQKDTNTKSKNDNKGEQEGKGGFFDTAINYLRTTYPKCFTNPPSPLAIGIHKQLKEQINVEGTPLADRKSIHVFLHFYISSLRYKSAFVIDAERRNLDGSVQSIITVDQVQLKKDKVKEEQGKR